MSAPAIAIDISGSMACTAGSSKRKIDLLTDVLQQVLPSAPCARVVAFASIATELVGLEPGPNLVLPEPGGGTAVHRALELVAGISPKPSRIVLISDGQPDDAQAAITAARALAPITIDAIYVGDDGDVSAIGFMRALALAGGSRHSLALQRSLADAKALAGEITLRLAGPTK